MSKLLIAKKCKDGWLITIKETIKVLDEEDVLSIIKKENLVPNYEINLMCPNRIFASENRKKRRLS